MKKTSVLLSSAGLALLLSGSPANAGFLDGLHKAFTATSSAFHGLSKGLTAAREKYGEYSQNVENYAQKAGSKIPAMTTGNKGKRKKGKN